MRNTLYLWVAVLCLCAASPASFCLGQTSDAFRNQMNTIFQNVNPTPISSGLLWDYGLELTDVTRYNGTITSSNYVNLAEWRMLYTSLYTMRFNNNISMTAPGTVNSQIRSNGMLSTAHNIIALHVRYQKFRSNATSQGVTISNNQLFCGNTTAPYETHYAFATTLNHSILEGNNHRFIFRSALFYNKSGKTISNIKADFGDGQGYRTISQNTEVTASYSTEGEKTLKLKITYTDATVAEGHCKFYVKIPFPPSARYNGTNILPQHFPLANFPAPRAYNGQVAGATVTVEYSGTNQILDRPLIVIEGFDPWRVLSPDDPNSNNSFFSFIRGSVNTQIHLDFQGQTLNDALEAGGYDLVFIDFDEGTDFIQRNAYLVQNVIQWVNEQKALHSTRQPNVVLGLSMGGLVGRYVLRDMEVNAITHDTRLLITNDAPHQGANIPLSAQAAVRHLAGIVIGFGTVGINYYTVTLADMNDDLKNAFTLVNTPAATQMLQYQLAGSGSNITINNSAHTTFMNEYRNLGHPQFAIRNVTIASGSECAPQQGFGPYATLLNIDETFSLKYWQTLLLYFLGSITPYHPQFFFGFPTVTKTDLKANLILNALPDHQAQRIYKGKIYLAKKILWVINVNATLVDKSVNAASTMLPLDSAPGGFLDISEFDSISAPSLPTDPFPRFCFVPTTSALDIGRGQQNIITADLLRVYTPSSPPPAPKNVPFANFFTHPVANIRHTQFTLQNGQWLMNELRNANPTFNCTQFCSINPTITGGASSVCFSSNTTFNISGALGFPVQWTVTPNLTIVSQNNTSITVRAAGSTTNGPATINANIVGAFCGTFAAPTRNITAGPYATSQILVSGQVPVCPGSQYWYTASPNGTGYTYSWTYPRGWSFVSQSGNQIALYVPTYSPSGGTVIVSINNGCGASGFSGITVYPVTCGTSTFAVYPNPADKQLNVELVSENDTTSTMSSPELNMASQDAFMESSSQPMEEFSIILYNQQQEVVATGASENQKLSLDASNLPTGTYFLHIHYKGDVAQKQVLIE